MATSAIPLDRTQYVKVVDSLTAGFQLSNNGSTPAKLIYGDDTQPVASTTAHHTIDGSGGTASRVAEGKVWMMGKGVVGIDL